MWNHKPQCDCPVCNCLPRVFQLIGTGTGLPGYPDFVAFLGGQLRHLEGELRDEVSRRFPGVHLFEGAKAAPPAAPPVREGEGTSQTGPAPPGPSAELLLASKAAPPVPPPQAEKASHSRSKQESDKAAEVPRSPKVSERKRNPTSSPRRRSRSRERRRSPRAEEKRRGVNRTPSPREEGKRKRSKDRDRKRRRSSSSKARRSEGGKEKKRHPERPSEPAYPPPNRRGSSHWGPREPDYPPPSRQGRGWQGELPRSSHPRWTSSENKGQVKRAKQELFNRRYHR